MKQLAIAVHRGPATRAWRGPLLLVLLSRVVARLFVFFSCCLMSIDRVVGRASGKKHKTFGNIRTLEVLIFNPNGPYIPVHSVGRSVSRRAAAMRGRWWITGPQAPINTISHTT